MEKEKRPMNYDELIGGFAFATETIDVNVPENTTGVYLLSKGERSSRGNLYVDYVGRAVATETEDLRKRLKNHLNNPDEQQSDESGRLVSMYKWFWFYVEESEEKAYERECLDYHRYGNIRALINKNHPAKRPGHPEDKCPVHGCEK